MSATPIRRHRATASIVGVVLGLGLLAGCSGQQTPDSYGDKVEAAFLRGCTTTAKGDGAEFDAKDFCSCAYDALSGQGGVKFDEFKRVNDQQIDDPSAPLPKSFTKVYAACAAEATGADAPADETSAEGADNGSTTTAPADATTTTALADTPTTEG